MIKNPNFLKSKKLKKVLEKPIKYYVKESNDGDVWAYYKYSIMYYSKKYNQVFKSAITETDLFYSNVYHQTTKIPTEVKNKFRKYFKLKKLKNEN